MNAFFASVEQVDHPQWRGKPVVLTNGKIGTCIITCSYEARAFGICSGMHIDRARQRCPDLIHAISRPQRYAQVSSQIMQALASFSPVIEIFSVDEAFLDMSACRRLWGTPRQMGEQVKQIVYQNSGVLCSIGISGDKTTAKYAAKLHKPDGLTIIPPWQAAEALSNCSLTDLCGINSGIANMLAQHGVTRCGDLQKLPISVLARRFGNPGRRIWLMAQGLDPEPVKTALGEAQSMGHGKVLPPDTRDIETIRTYLMHMAHKLGERLRRNQLVAQQFLFGFRLHRGWLKANSRSLLPCDDEKVIFSLGNRWLSSHWKGQGIWQIRIIALDPGRPCQSDLFNRKHPQREKTHQTMDTINQRYGSMTLTAARLLDRSSMPDVISPAWKPSGYRKTV